MTATALQAWVLLNFLMDFRTGLGCFQEFQISNYELMMQLIEHRREHTVEQILALPDTRERVDLSTAHRGLFIERIRRCTVIHGTLAPVDLRDEDVIYVGNRFAIDALFPERDVSTHVPWGVNKQNTVFAVGKSIVDRRCPIDVGELCQNDPMVASHGELTWP